MKGPLSRFVSDLVRVYEFTGTPEAMTAVIEYLVDFRGRGQEGRTA